MSDLLLPPRVIRVIDFEATGQEPPEDSSIIEVGWCDLTETQGGWQIDPRAQHLLVRPTTPMMVEAMAIHHLRERDLVNGNSREHALFYATGGPNVIAYAAHGAKFEMAMWPEAAHPWIDTYKLAMQLYPDAPRHSNQVLRYYLDLDLPHHMAMPPHRAGPDAYVTAHILARLLATGLSVDEAIAISAKPVLLARVPFGQHRGYRWQDMDRGFLEWVAVRDFSEDILYTARFEIDRREAEYEAERAAYAAEEDAQPDPEIVALARSKAPWDA